MDKEELKVMSAWAVIGIASTIKGTIGEHIADKNDLIKNKISEGLFEHEDCTAEYLKVLAVKYRKIVED